MCTHVGFKKTWAGHMSGWVGGKFLQLFTAVSQRVLFFIAIFLEVSDVPG